MTSRIGVLTGFLITAVLFSGGSVWAKKFEVKVNYSYNAETQCVIDDVAVDPKTVWLDPTKHLLRLGNTKVDWILVPNGDAAVGVDWLITRIGSDPDDFKHCPDIIPFSNPWRCKVKNKILGEGYWEYKLEAIKSGCATILADPEIRFEKGNDLTGKNRAALALILIAVVVVAAFGYRAWRRRQGTGGPG